MQKEDVLRKLVLMSKMYKSYSLNHALEALYLYFDYGFGNDYLPKLNWIILKELLIAVNNDYCENGIYDKHCIYKGTNTLLLKKTHN